MSEVASLYGTLASAASIFIGIIAALLVNRTLNVETEKTQLRHHVAQINSQRKGVKKRREEIDERLEALFDSDLKQQIRQRANDDLNDFIEGFQSDELDIDDSDNQFFAILDAFEEFVGETDWSDFYHQDVLRRRFSEVLSELNVKGTSRFTPLEWEIRNLRGSVNANNNSQILDRRIADRRVLNQDLFKLKNHYGWLSSRLKGLDGNQNKKSLRVLVISLVASVIFPIIFYSLHTVGPVIDNSPLLADIEILGILLLWVSGLAIVIVHLHSEMTEKDQKDIEELYEVELNSFSEALPNLTEIPDDIPVAQRENYVREKEKEETVRYVNMSEQEQSN